MVQGSRRLNKLKMLALLDELERRGGAATSLYIPSGLHMSEIEKMLDIVSDSKDIQTDIARISARSATGAVAFWGEQARYLILPPFPFNEKLISSGYDVEPYRLLLQRELTVALIFVRLGAYAIGIFQGERLMSSKLGKGLVHSRHKKGGSSQRRFERNREKQIESFFDRVCVRTRERLEPYMERLDYIVYGGERHTLLSFRKQCRFLSQFDDCVVESLLNVREPGQATLEAAIGDAWSSRVIEWQESAASGVEA